MTDTQKRQDLFTCWLAVISLLLGWMLYRQTPPSFSQSAAALPVYNVTYDLALPDPMQGGGSNPENPWAFIRQTGPSYAQPGGTASYALTLANYEAMTRTFTLTDTLPAALTFVPNSNRELRYNPVTRQLTWQGDIAPGHLDYLIEPSGLSLPYIDLADFGAPNLCDELIATQGNCDEATVTLNLGVNGYTYPFYGQTWQSITLSPDGLLLAGAAATGTVGDKGFEQESYVSGFPVQTLSDATHLPNPGQVAAAGSRPTAPTSQNQWLPNPNPPGALIAPLWYDADMTTSGRWHVAILQGLITGYDVLYVQWHNAPHAAAPNLTTRHAAALILGDGPLSGQVFFITDNISDPLALTQVGYTIGVEDYPGSRGTTYAYAPCCGDPQPPQGFPPAPGTTLHLRPVIYGQYFSRTFTYTVQVGGQIPQTIANTAEVTTNSDDPSLIYGWSTHYLYLRHLTFLPFLTGGDQ
ncbi:MAG: DUF11 domain-containing protein [Chloroflexi bacterium]|nr:DUF11 domain-containing protein [Chloroflexota bacterium]MBP8057990.1 DUF11 domain-containing protein [Chloroflexota bacterium]